MLRRSSFMFSSAGNSTICGCSPRRSARARPSATSMPLPAAENGAKLAYTATRSVPGCCSSSSAAAARSGLAASRASAPAPSRKRRRSLFFMDSLQPRADRPHGFLGEHALEGRHVHRAVAGDAVAHFADEVFVHVVAALEEAQVGGDAARHRAQAVAARTVLVEG